MNAQSSLATSAEIGIGIAGFAGIAGVLRRRGQGAWTPHDIFRMRILLRGSFAVVLLSLLPIALATTAVEETTQWFVASGLYAVFLALAFAVGIRQLRRELGLSTELFERSCALFLPSIAILGFTLNIANVVIFRTAWPYLFSLVLALTLAFVQFVRLLRSLWQPPQSEA